MGEKEKIVIWGASGHARVVADIIRLENRHEIVGFLDDLAPQRKGALFVDWPILGGREALADLHRQGVRWAVVAIGNCQARLTLAGVARDAGFELARAIHPSAIVARGVDVGEGTVIAAGAVVNPGAHIGNHVIVNTRAGIDHDCIIEDGAHICPGVSLAGNVRVGRLAWVGIGSTVIEKRVIGAGAFIAAGAVVVSDIPAGAFARGVPARCVTKAVPANRDFTQS